MANKSARRKAAFKAKIRKRAARRFGLLKKNRNGRLKGRVRKIYLAGA
jgi:hypothetical protein